MQLATLLSLSLAAFSFTPTTLACYWNLDKSKSQDCCWGGKSDPRINNEYGYAGCYNQHWKDVCNKAKYKDDWCSNHNVTEQDCNADCCSVTSKKGIACP
ncbi:hypothetical protein Vi05172_g13442 [Venturia inaequalis]|nr:hypothetical protein Vi05172_g13442 [Venturia inaequalis]